MNFYIIEIHSLTFSEVKTLQFARYELKDDF
jgi:hypothetical protein